MAAALPEFRAESGASLVESALVWAAAALGIVAASLVGGVVVERFGARRTGAVGLLVGALACAARGACDSPLALAALMFLFGLQIGFVAPAVSRALASGVAPASLGRANRRVLVVYGVGTMACFALAPSLGLRWQAAMVAIGVAMAVAAGAWFLTVRDDRTLAPPAATWDDLRSVARNRGVRRVASVQFLLFGSYLAMLVVLPPLLSGRGASPTLPALWLAVAVVANVVGSRWSDRLGLRRPFIVGGAALAAGSLIGLALGGPVELILLTAVGGGLVAPIVATLPLELPYAGAPALGAALGVVLVVGQLGGVLLPLVTAAALQHAGAEAALTMLAAAHLLILIPAGRLAETGPSAPVPAAQVDFGGAAA
jgi:nitrate/nitrite transporter NarK